MKTSIERLDDTHVRLTVVIDAVDVDKAMDDAYKEMGRRTRIKGFRRGKAPREMIDQAVGVDTVRDDARGRLLGETFGVALNDADLYTIDRADMDDAPLLVPGEGYTYVAEVEVRPSLKLSSYDDIEVTAPSIEVSDEEIDVYVEDLRSRFGKLDTAERPVQMGDYVSLSWIGSIDGVTHKDSSAEEHLYEMGAGNMPPFFDEQLLGVSAGEHAIFDYVIPDTAPKAEYRGKTAGFDVAVYEVMQFRLPDVDLAFADEIGAFESIEEMRADMAGALRERKEEARIRGIEAAARTALADRLVGDVPPKMVDARYHTLVEELVGHISESDRKFEDFVRGFGMTPAEFKHQLHTEAGLRVRDELALTALYNAVGLSITEEAIDAEVAAMAVEQKTEPETMRANLEGAGGMPIVREDVKHAAAVEWLINHIKIVDEAPEVLKLSADVDQVDAEVDAAEQKSAAAKASAKKASAKKAPAKKASDADAKKE